MNRFICRCGETSRIVTMEQAGMTDVIAVKQLPDDCVDVCHSSPILMDKTRVVPEGRT